MPIYEYECAACQGTFEEMQRITAAPLRKCRLCGSGGVRRLISRTSFQLKGTGWYVTDYARKDAGKRASAKDSNASSAVSDSKSSTESKASAPNAASSS